MKVDWLDQISGRRIETIIRDIYSISKGPLKGRIAYAFTAIENEIFRYIKSYVYELNSTYSYLNRNLDTYEDAIGNLYISLDSDKDKFAACGSHVDSVINGGAYDGVAGVAAGLEIFRVLYENNVQAKCGFRIIVFRGEESSMTGEALMGSGVATGQIGPKKLHEMTYGLKEKIPFEFYMKGMRYNWLEILALSENPIIMPSQYSCYLEMHIEQGTVLEKAGLNVGVVGNGIGGAVRLELKTGLSQTKYEIKTDESLFVFKVKGRRNHTGGTPMNGVRGERYRDDALVKSADLVEALINDGGGRMVKWYTKNFAYNIVPGQVDFLMILKNDWFDHVDLPAEIFEDFVEVKKDNYRGEREIWDKKTVISAANVIRDVEQIGEHYAGLTDGLICATIGGIGRVDKELILTFDLRNLDEKRRKEALVDVRKSLKDNEFGYDLIADSKPVYFGKKIPKALGLIYKELFLKEPFYLPSMPGHDARNMAKLGIPTGMIFTACKDGVSHSVREYASPLALEEGARLLGAGLVYFANRG